MFALFMECIKTYHEEDSVDSILKNPLKKSSLEAKIYHKNWIDTVQWHLEDIIRDPQIKPELALKIKRRIDASNQQRTDLVEQIDDIYMEQFSKIDVQHDARLNTESIAWAIDRLSILALKIYHMQLEAGRLDIAPALKEKNALKAQVLEEQKQDLCLSIDQLLDDIESGKRTVKVYRQMKMYNDPELNPVLYQQKSE
jgi:hypothetical protein